MDPGREALFLSAAFIFSAPERKAAALRTMGGYSDSGSGADLAWDFQSQRGADPSSGAPGQVAALHC